VFVFVGEKTTYITSSADHVNNRM